MTATLFIILFVLYCSRKVHAECVGYAESCRSIINIPDCSYGGLGNTCGIFMDSCRITCEQQPGCSCRRRDLGCRDVGFLRVCDASIDCEGTASCARHNDDERSCRDTRGCEWFDNNNSDENEEGEDNDGGTTPAMTPAGAPPTRRPTTRRPTPRPTTPRTTPRPTTVPPTSTPFSYTMEDCEYDTEQDAYECNQDLSNAFFPWKYYIKGGHGCPFASSTLQEAMENNCSCEAAVYVEEKGHSVFCQDHCEFQRISGSNHFLVEFDCQDRLPSPCVGLTFGNECMETSVPTTLPAELPAPSPYTVEGCNYTAEGIMKVDKYDCNWDCWEGENCPYFPWPYYLVLDPNAKDCWSADLQNYLYYFSSPSRQGCGCLARIVEVGGYKECQECQFHRVPGSLDSFRASFDCSNWKSGSCVGLDENGVCLGNTNDQEDAESNIFLTPDTTPTRNVTDDPNELLWKPSNLTALVNGDYYEDLSTDDTFYDNASSTSLPGIGIPIDPEDPTGNFVDTPGFDSPADPEPLSMDDSAIGSTRDSSSSSDGLMMGYVLIIPVSLAWIQWHGD